LDVFVLTVILANKFSSLSHADKWTGDWWLYLGFRVGIALVVALLVPVVGRRYVHRARRRADNSGDDVEGRRRRRTVTVVSLVAATLTVVVWFTVLLSLLSWLGVSIGPLLASAGIAGVALGFGAQTLVRDTISGLFIFLEGQFDVGDTVDLQTAGGLVSGTVEGLTLRITSVRQFDGTLSIVPNGSINITSNKTRGWGRAIVDVRVALDEDADHVRNALQELFDLLVKEEPFETDLRKEPQVLGVMETTDYAQVIRVIAETQPSKRAVIERLLRERITTTIAESGIRVPPTSARAAVSTVGEQGL
jgi:small-conductance mechanosensitive channel